MDYRNSIIDLLITHSCVGISVNIGTVEGGLSISRLIRAHSPETTIIMGGPHATAIYDKLIPEYADIVVRGEGEYTVNEILDSKPLSQIKGIAYWDNGLKLTPLRPPIEDLDSLPTPAFHLLNFRAYKMNGLRWPSSPLITSRGCPYQCIFCTKFIHGSRLRLRSVNNVMNEIDQMVNNYKVKEIAINDDCFTFYPDRVKEICNNIIKRKYRDLNFSLHNGIRADYCDREMFSLMRKAGFRHVRLGIESGSQDVLDKVKKDLNLQKVQQTARALKEAGIGVGASFILGLPFESPKTMRDTIDFAKSLSLDQAHFVIATPFPGTEMYEIVKEKGRFLQDLMLKSAHMFKPSYEMGAVESDKVSKMLIRAYCEFYFRPQIMLRINSRHKLDPFFMMVKILMRKLVQSR